MTISSGNVEEVCAPHAFKALHLISLQLISSIGGHGNVLSLLFRMAFFRASPDNIFIGEAWIRCYQGYSSNSSRYARSVHSSCFRTLVGAAIQTTSNLGYVRMILQSAINNNSTVLPKRAQSIFHLPFQHEIERSPSETDIPPELDPQLFPVVAACVLQEYNTSILGTNEIELFSFLL
jgi:hypothetical protein